MADVESNLSPDQRAALEQYIAVTNQDTRAAIALLGRTQWNVQIAIARFFDGEPTIDPVREALDALPTDARLHDTLIDSFIASPRRPASTFPPAPRIVPPPNANTAYRAGFPLTLLLAPFSLASFVATRLFRLCAYFIPFLPALLARFTSPSPSRLSNRRPLKTQDSAARFIREFEEDYGSHQLPFRELGYAHCLDEAKHDLKYLLVILISPEHDDTSSWIRKTLLDPSVAAFLRDQNNHTILWAGSVQDPEAYQISTAFNVTKFPFAALVANTPTSASSTATHTPSSSGMSIIAALSGLLSASDFLARIRQAIDSHSPELNRLRSERAERSATRTIREEQDNAYQRSLAADRERARAKREDLQRQSLQGQHELQRQQQRAAASHQLQQWKSWRFQGLLDEPPTHDTDAIRVSIRLTNGDRAIRRFPADASVEEIYAFVECFDLSSSNPSISSEQPSPPSDFIHTYKFQLVSPLPRTVYQVTDRLPVAKLIGKRANLIVEPLEEEEEE